MREGVAAIAIEEAERLGDWALVGEGTVLASLAKDVVVLELFDAVGLQGGVRCVLVCNICQLTDQ